MLLGSVSQKSQLEISTKVIEPSLGVPVACHATDRREGPRLLPKGGTTEQRPFAEIANRSRN